MTARKNPTVLIPLPHLDADPTEVAVSWKVLRAQDIEVHFATPDGAMARCDPRMVSGEGLDLWGFIPGLKKIKLLGLSLRANRAARLAHAEMQSDPRFLAPKAYSALTLDEFD